MAIITVGISVLPNHTHNTDASNDGGALSDATVIENMRLSAYILFTGSATATA